jgi:D-sedoheptulose 7-phosphate isomerase
MTAKGKELLDDLFRSHPDLSICKDSIQTAFSILKDCYDQGGKVLVCGNGGSASDSEHIVGELMKGFMRKREINMPHRNQLCEMFPAVGSYLAEHLQGALPAISLVSQTGFTTAYGNDVAADMVFAQQVYGYSKKGDVLIGLSTSGNSKNVIHALMVAKALAVATIGFTGCTGGRMKDLCDAAIMVPAADTFRVQEYHLPIYHTLCAMIEAEYFNE